MKRLGVIATPMWHHYYYYPTPGLYPGETVAQRTEQIPRYVDAGLTVAMGTDISTIPLNYFAGIYFMVTRNMEVGPSQSLWLSRAKRCR
ncbi:MAG: hypothetical protein U0Y68_23655 [Blastocatellia bacterium]